MPGILCPKENHFSYSLAANLFTIQTYCGASHRCVNDLINSSWLEVSGNYENLILSCNAKGKFSKFSNFPSDAVLCCVQLTKVSISTKPTPVVIMDAPCDWFGWTAQWIRGLGLMSPQNKPTQSSPVPY